MKNAVKVGQYIITSDNQGTISSIDTKNNDKVVSTKEIGKRFSGGIAYDKTTNMIYFVAGTNDLYGVKVGNDGTFGEEKSVRVYETGYSAMTPEVYNGKVYVSGCVGTSPFSDKGYLAVVDVQSEQYKVNYIVELPAWEKC